VLGLLPLDHAARRPGVRQHWAAHSVNFDFFVAMGPECRRASSSERSHFSGTSLDPQRDFHGWQIGT
jgi:hypothetical protein